MAGEPRQTQVLPSPYLTFAVDHDGSGQRDLVRSTPDVLASTADALSGYGWQKGRHRTKGNAGVEVLREWNKSEVYSKTLASFAARLNGG